MCWAWLVEGLGSGKYSGKILAASAAAGKGETPAFADRYHFHGLSGLRLNW